MIDSCLAIPRCASLQPCRLATRETTGSNMLPVEKRCVLHASVHGGIHASARCGGALIRDREGHYLEGADLELNLCPLVLPAAQRE